MGLVPDGEIQFDVNELFKMSPKTLKDLTGEDPVIEMGEIVVDEDGNFEMAQEVFEKLTEYEAEPDVGDDEKGTEIDKGRKDYCCHNNADGRCKVIRASNGASAAIKCMAHYAGRPVNSHKGNCRH
ncbi:MAG: hypothetical protein ACYTDT_12095 [Planctomycetota bacterium]|jgi:hypothetical protein